jgi:hypothetical protein
MGTKTPIAGPTGKAFLTPGLARGRRQVVVRAYLLRALPRVASLVDPWWTLDWVDQARGVDSVPALCLG